MCALNEVRKRALESINADIAREKTPARNAKTLFECSKKQPSVGNSTLSISCQLLRYIRRGCYELFQVVRYLVPRWGLHRAADRLGTGILCMYGQVTCAR